MPELPKKREDLLWYRLTYSVTAIGAELAHGVLPLFESVQDFALHISAPYRLKLQVISEVRVISL